MRRRILGAAMVATVALAACSGSSEGRPSPSVPSDRPSSPARLTISSPHNGEIVHGTTVKVRIKLSGARVVRATTKDITPRTGHLHVFLDDRLVSMNYGRSDEVKVRRPGTHVLRVEFVASDHLPFDPQVVATSAFEVKA